VMPMSTDTATTKNGRDSRYIRMEEVCTPHAASSYKQMDNNRLAVYALGILEENGMPRTQEAISVALFLMFPEKFSMVGFPQYPDTERVNRTLLQLGQKYRNWATGNRHVGYTLNDAGHHVLDQTKVFLRDPGLQAPKKKTPRIRTRDPNAEIMEIQESNLFRAFSTKHTENVNEYDFWELMQAFPYTPRAALRNRFKEMREAARLAANNQVMEFLRWVQGTYSKFFEETKT